MYWDTLLLLPLFIAVGVYYYELFKPQEDLLKEVDEKIEYSIEDSCASEGSTLLLRYNKKQQETSYVSNIQKQHTNLQDRFTHSSDNDRSNIRGET